MDTVTEKEPIIEGKLRFAYSFSRIGVYDACPKKFEFQVIKKLKPKTMPPFVLVGGVVHRFIERYLLHCKGNDVESDFGSAPKLIEGTFAESKELSQRYFDEVESICMKFVRNHKYDRDYTAGIEMRMALDIFGNSVQWMDKNVFMRGIIDMLRKHSQKVEITDWKTGFSTEYDPFQLKLYALMLSYLYPGTEQFDVYLQFIRQGVVKGETFYPDEIDKFKTQLRTVIKKIETDTEFKPKPGAACAYCSFYDQCPAGQEEVKIIGSEDQARIAVEQIAFQERKVQDMKESLKNYCSVAGPISHNGLEFGFVTSETSKIDGAGFLKLCQERGIDVGDLVTVPKLKLKRLLKTASPDFVTAIKLMTDTEKKVTFKAKKT